MGTNVCFYRMILKMLLWLVGMYLQIGQKLLLVSGAPISEYGVSVIDELAEVLQIDPIDFRLKNVCERGNKGPSWPSLSQLNSS